MPCEFCEHEDCGCFTRYDLHGPYDCTCEGPAYEGSLDFDWAMEAWLERDRSER